jgi:hypothetical protein
VKKIIRIQAAWRGHNARKMFQQLIHQSNPSLPIIRQFVSILTPCADEFQKENEIQVSDVLQLPVINNFLFF